MVVKVQKCTIIRSKIQCVIFLGQYPFQYGINSGCIVIYNIRNKFVEGGYINLREFALVNVSNIFDSLETVFGHCFQLFSYHPSAKSFGETLSGRPMLSIVFFITGFSRRHRCFVATVNGWDCAVVPVKLHFVKSKC